MSISYPLAFPTVSGIYSIEWLKDIAVSMSENPFSKSQSFYDWQGKRFEAAITIPPMLIENGRIWEAWFLSLNGPIGTFWLSPSLDSVARGIATGTPLVNGASQTGQSLITDGWTISQTGIMKAGDWIQIGNYLHRVLIDADSDISGNATLDIWPNLRSAPADDLALVVSSCKGLFRVAEMPALGFDRDQLCAGFKFKAIEAI